ncbi:ion channel [Flavobacterium stagni]|uniref:Inward rectifier potassium channel Irk n=1 Tax=Flavobacterium stagni TaxID=2506421 RepID=A0A4Q1K880_9FLAO|nr:ion channel [Flavobacterium stagni]RXR22509.1 Inward rectifier potassium channel Irk [Flavobacterium stagni]
MAFRTPFNSKARTDANTGLGTNAASYGGRFFTKSGNANIRKSGIPFLDSISWYHTMLTLPRWKFFVIICGFYFLVNSVFASMYYALGVEHLNGVNANSSWDAFGQAFFFSVQTFTTVGYGHVSPSGFLTSFVAAVEALFGLLSFAIATGLFYGRFSQPKAHILFSHNAIIAPYKGGTALMLRMCPSKNANLSDAEARVTLGMHVEENGQMVNKFFTLDLELSTINALNLNWTLVHPITEDSPLYQFTATDFENTVGELIVFLKMFDDMYSNTVMKRTSYTFDEIVYGARFLPMFTRDVNQQKTILQIDKLNAIEKVQL